MAYTLTFAAALPGELTDELGQGRVNNVVDHPAGRLRSLFHNCRHALLELAPVLLTRRAIVNLAPAE